MSGASGAANSHSEPGLGELTALALISASVLGLEMALMRSLSVSRWHHFAYLVVSLALLGFGASGTWLALLTPRLFSRFSTWSRELTLLLALSTTLCYRLAQLLPINMRYLLFSGTQLFYLFCYQALIFLPFLLAGFLIGLTILRFPTSVHRVYGANLLGSGLGPLIAVCLMVWLPPARLIQAAAVLIWAAVFLWPPEPGAESRWRRAASPLLVGLFLAADLLLPVSERLDPNKMLAQLQLWQEQGDARRLLTRYGPRARLDVFASPHLHYTLFAGLTASTPPPSQLLLLTDGNIAGPIFLITNASEAPILDHTPMSVAYRLLPGARVALLGEASGVNIWLARRFAAPHITMVQANPQIIELLLGPLGPMSGQVLTGEDLTIQMATPRHFLERSRDQFDLIQVVTAEGMAAGVSGLLSLHENYLLTVEGLARALEHLSQRGLVSITRGLQSPPRDNIKILATCAAALERMGVKRPADHLVQVRNHLAVCTLAFRQPLRHEQVRELLRISDQLWLDIDTLPGYDPTTRPSFNRLVTPPGVKGSLFQLAATEILSADRERFFESWAYNVRPATDDRPYFFDFFRWRSLPSFITSYGPHWFQRLELGYAVLVISLIEIVAAALLLLLVPLFWRTGWREAIPERGPGLTYFFLLGLAFLALEMTLMQRCTLLLGDPLLAAAGVLSAFLFFSGCGSLWSGRRPGSPLASIAVSVGGIAVMAPLILFLTSRLLVPLSSWGTPGRFLTTLTLLAPLAFLMGWPFPAGILLLEERSPALLPWAWGVNGFASVAAAPFAVLLAMSLGFRLVLALAVVCYLLALLLALRFGRRKGAKPQV
jgi:hypothetical protein